MEQKQNQNPNPQENPGTPQEPEQPGAFKQAALRAYTWTANQAIDLGKQANEHKKLTACSFVGGMAACKLVGKAAKWWLSK